MHKTILMLLIFVSSGVMAEWVEFALLITLENRRG